jgi:hypothetical protein
VAALAAPLCATLLPLPLLIGCSEPLSCIVAHRPTKIGIRIALRAQREQVMRLMLRDGSARQSGLVLGLIGSLGVARLIQPMLYRTPAVDPVVYLLVRATLLSVAILAAGCQHGDPPVSIQ